MMSLMRPLLSLLFLLLLPCAAVRAQDFSVAPVSDSLFARMQGRSYPEGCTVPLSDLRHVRVLHVDAQGKTHRGELVCNKAIAQDLVDIFRRLYQARYPIEKIRLIDDYDTDDGVFAHEGAHDYTFSRHTAQSCTEDEADEYVCSVCGQTHREVTKPATVTQPGEKTSSAILITGSFP